MKYKVYNDEIDVTALLDMTRGKHQVILVRSIWNKRFIYKIR